MSAAGATPYRVVEFRRLATKLLLIEQWVLLPPIAVAAYFVGNSWLGVLAVGGVFHAITSLSRHHDPVGLTTRTLIATGILLDVLLLIYALTGAGSWQMDGGHMIVFAVWSHCLALLCWRSLWISGTLGVLHHAVLVFVFPLWVFPDGANVWRVALHAGVVVLQLSVLSVFVFFIIKMLSNAEELEKSLAASAAQAAEADQAKSRFLAFMSHELRTPLNAIIGFSDTIVRQIFGTLPARYHGYAQDIYGSGQHLLALIDDILDLSKIESGRYELAECDVEVPALLTYCVKMLEGRAIENRIAVRCVASPTMPMLRADDRALRQVVLNLLSNAIKYTGPSGVITVEATETRAGLAIHVADSGCGIPAEAMVRIFEPFNRGDPVLSRKVQGTGLGLTISRHLMRLHGGDLTLDSVPGRGTTATAWLPANRVVRPAADESTAHQRVTVAEPAAERLPVPQFSAGD